MESIDPSTIQFLRALEKNNNRDWFEKNRSSYLLAQTNMHHFIDELITAMRSHDEIETESGKKSLYRIYNDVRFSKNKLPYNARFAFRMQRATKLKRGGYYVHIKPGNSFMACGFFAPNPEDLKRIRMDILYNENEWRKILKNKNILQNFGNIRGEKVATVPRGFDKNHPAIDLMRQKQFLFRHDFDEKEITGNDLLIKINTIFKSIRPFFDHMSEVLTTDLNGESIL